MKGLLYVGAVAVCAVSSVVVPVGYQVWRSAREVYLWLSN